jgi:hypothetical protein
MGSPNEEPVRVFAEAVTRADPELAVSVSDPEIEFLSVLAVSGRAYHGHDGVRRYFADYREHEQALRASGIVP